MGAFMEQERGHILIVEDNPNDAALTAHELIVAGGVKNPLDIVSTARDALVAMSRNRPVLALIDLTLPGEDGFAVIRDVRDTYDSGQVPIIVVSGSDSPEHRQRAQSIGADGYLVKPLDFHRLHTEVLRLGLSLYFVNRMARSG